MGEFMQGVRDSELGTKIEVLKSFENSVLTDLVAVWSEGQSGRPTTPLWILPSGPEHPHHTALYCPNCLPVMAGSG